MSKNKYKGIHPYLVNQIRYHARSLIRHAAIHAVEIEDLEQELMLDFLSRKQAYNPEKGKWSTFVDRVLNHKCANLIKTARAQKRGLGLTDFSLDIWLENEDDEAKNLIDPISEYLTNQHLQIDLKYTIQRMPPHLAILLIDLQTLNISEISRKTKTSRWATYKTLSELRNFLKKNRLMDYLK